MFTMRKSTRTFGAALRAQRALLGLTQREVADRARVSVRALRYIENGSAPRPDLLRRLASTVGLDSAVFTRTPSARIRILGPLEVEGVPVPLMQRRLLGLLALHPNQVVTREEIIDALWLDSPPHSHVHLVHNYVARLRSFSAVERAHGGYRLVADCGGLDLLRFNELLSRSDLAGLSEAVGLWRGPALADLPAEVRLHPNAIALHQRRIAAVLAHTDMVLGAPGEPFSPSLITLAHDEPLHEGLQARLMLALARTGQQASALRLFERVRDRLAAELGVEPRRDLRDAHLRVLRQEV
ncbi:DNA-binding transcriptional activator of the SARP family [Lentzea waywayandensis]|uniref:DNA-binding transcriptional activator of the SARP family n=2 Tax=Lentzea waywayandensis TaxID=84724 RepID=A0A1I6DCS1_9PSEU|nr:DNA-binding transcriptional activator of the SARP family [Lentzea waywayandensis]